MSTKHAASSIFWIWRIKFTPAEVVAVFTPEAIIVAFVLGGVMIFTDPIVTRMRTFHVGFPEFVSATVRAAAAKTNR